MLRELDGMPRGVTSDEASFLDLAIKEMEGGKSLSETKAKRLALMYGKYFAAPIDEDLVGAKREETDEDDIDDDDFV